MESVRKALLCDNAPVDGSGVRVVVLDTGVDLDHPDLANCVNRGLSQSKCLSNDIVDRHGHGTHIASIVAGSGECSDGRFRGIAPGAELVAVKVQPGMHGYAIDVAAGVDFAIEVGADIINYSGGHGTEGWPPWKWPTRLGTRDEIFQVAMDQGILCVAAAGNEAYFNGEPQFGSVIRPGNLRYALCVGATVGTGKVSECSGRGPVYLDPSLPAGVVDRASPGFDAIEAEYRKPDVVAPGGDLVREAAYVPGYDSDGHVFGPIGAFARFATGVDPVEPSQDCRYARVSGTSQATAIVSGLAALTLQYARKTGLGLGDNPGRSLRAIIKKSAIPLKLGDWRDYGEGLPMWPHIMATIDDCNNNPSMREAVLFGPYLELSAPPDD